MTFAHGWLALISRPPIYPQNAKPALRDCVSPGDHATDASIFTGNSPTIALTAADCGDRRPQSRTTIA